jgi:hypothetical protein
MSSAFRIVVSAYADQRLAALAEETRSRLFAMLQDIAELAAGLAPEGATWVKPLPDQLLYLGVGQTSARYSLDVERRTVTVEHIVVGWEGRTQAADPSKPG